MEDYQYSNLLYIIKMPFILITYIIYMFFTLFIPSRYLQRIVNIKSIENDMNSFFEDPLFLKMIALIITVIIFIYFH